MPDEQKFWFPAKRYGWGWSPPSRWQGWAVLVAYFGLLGLAALRLRPDRELPVFLAFVTFLSVLLVAICWLKGEPPRWRWGKD
jgi:hypothetical protein